MLFSFKNFVSNSAELEKEVLIRNEFILFRGLGVAFFGGFWVVWVFFVVKDNL